MRFSVCTEANIHKQRVTCVTKCTHNITSIQIQVIYSIYFNIYFSRAQAKTGSSTVTWLQTWNKQLKWRRINCWDIISHNIHSFHRQQIHLETFQQGREANLYGEGPRLDHSDKLCKQEYIWVQADSSSRSRSELSAGRRTLSVRAGFGAKVLKNLKKWMSHPLTRLWPKVTTSSDFKTCSKTTVCHLSTLVFV